MMPYGVQPDSRQETMGFRNDVCEDRGVPRPATGQTPLRTIRVPQHIWQAAKDKAAREGRTLTGVIVAYLRRYIAAPDRPRGE